MRAVDLDVSFLFLFFSFFLGGGGVIGHPLMMCFINEPVSVEHTHIQVPQCIMPLQWEKKNPNRAEPAY
jgi:hypothetical protein